MNLRGFPDLPSGRLLGFPGRPNIKIQRKASFDADWSQSSSRLAEFWCFEKLAQTGPWAPPGQPNIETVRRKRIRSCCRPGHENLTGDRKPGRPTMRKLSDRNLHDMKMPGLGGPRVQIVQKE